MAVSRSSGAGRQGFWGNFWGNINKILSGSFNADSINNTINSVQKNYTMVSSELSGVMQRKFVDESANIWCSPKAELFFITVRDVDLQMIHKVNDLYSKVVEKIKKAAISWATATRTSINFPPEVDYFETELDISGIKKMSDYGYVVVDKEALLALIPSLKEIQSNVYGLLVETQHELLGVGLFDKNDTQINALISSFQDVAEKIFNTLDDMINVFSNYINDTTQDASNVTEANTIAFGGLGYASAAENTNQTQEEPPTQTPVNVSSGTININYSSIAEQAKYDYAKENYEALCNQYGAQYGVDPKLLLATIAQENPFNAVKDVNRGVCCIENIWWGTELTAYNQNTGQYDTITIDVNKLINPADSIQTGAMIYASYFDYLNKQCPNISASDKILASVIGNNKGIYGIVDLIHNYGSDFVNHIAETPGGDNEYIEHVLSYVPSGSTLCMKTPDGAQVSATINVNS